MAVAKKDARNIRLDWALGPPGAESPPAALASGSHRTSPARSFIHFRWRATGNDGWISLVVWPHMLPGQKVTCSFDYDQTWLVQDDPEHVRLIRQLVVTNRLVRRVLLHALAQGYRPDVKKKGQLDLGPAEQFLQTDDAVRASWP